MVGWTYCYAVRREWGSGALYPVKGGRYWRVSVPLPAGPFGRRRQEWQFRTEAAARRQLESVQRRLARGLPAEESRMTVAQAATDWLAQHQAKPHTLATYRSVIRHQLGDLADMPVTRLWPADIRRLLAERQREGYSGRTRRLILDVLRWTLRMAQSDGIVERNVAELVDPPAIEAKEPVHFTAEQARRFLDAAKGDPLYSLYAVAIGTGLRRGELLALQWREVDTRDGMVGVRRGKTAASARLVPLPAFARAALDQYRHRLGSDGHRRVGPIWPYSSSYVSAHVKVICKRAGLPEVTFHSLRHSAASILLAEGVPMEIIKSILGHSRAAMTGHYARPEDEAKREALERLGRAVAG